MLILQACYLLISFLLVGLVTAMNFEPTRCTDSNRTVYLRTEAVIVEEPAAVTLIDLSLNECAKKCTGNIDGIDCRSFEYNSDKQSCALKESNGQPFGRSILSSANQPGVAFFQKICIPSDELCSAPYTFDRFPQHVLSGHAMEVFATDNLSSCLLKCLESRKRMHMDCRSVMYFYESGQCILNREHQKTVPTNMFSNETHFQLVDYFENNCFDINCFGDSQLHWISTQDFGIDSRKDVVLNGFSVEQCKQACQDNQVGIEVFPCKSFVFSASKQECQLSAESGIIQHHTNQSNTDNLATTEVHAPDKTTLLVGEESPATAASLKQGIGTELRDFSTGEYFEKICLSGSAKCKEGSFELTPNRMMDSRDKVISTTSLNYCLEQCLLLAQNCSSAVFFKEKDECVLNKKSQFSHPELFHPAEGVDYYDNVCDLLPGTQPPSSIQKDQEKAAMSVTIEDPELEKPHSRTAKKVPRQKPVFTPHKHTSPYKTSKEVVETECRLSGIQILVHFDQASAGALFVRDHSASCATNFEAAFEAILKIPLPSSTDSNPKCAGVELAPNFWQFLVVLQKNNLGITSLMTGSDRVFNVTCDFSNLLLSAQPNKHHATVGSNTSSTAAAGLADNQIETEPLEHKTVHMMLLRQGRPVTTVSLGEELELRWTFSSNPSKQKDSKGHNKLGKTVLRRSTQYGFFVENCTAERLDGLAPEPPPLPLVTKGCPDARIREQLMRDPISKIFDGFNTSVKVFRFDGSRRVRIKCSVNICVEQCKPVVCPFGEDVDDTKLSYGRRKRRQTIGELAELVEKYDKVRNEVLRKKLGNGDTIQQSTITGSYTIMDGAIEPSSNGHPSERGSVNSTHPNKPSNPFAEKDEKDLPPASKDQYLASSSTSSTCGEGVNNQAFIRSSSICLQRTVFIALLVAVAFLTTVQTFHLLQIICKKCAEEDQREEGENNSSLYNQRQLTSNSSSTSSDCCYYRTYLHSPNSPPRPSKAVKSAFVTRHNNYGFHEEDEQGESSPCGAKSVTTSPLAFSSLVDLSEMNEISRRSTVDRRTKKRECMSLEKPITQNAHSTNFPVTRQNCDDQQKRDREYLTRMYNAPRNNSVKREVQRLYV